MINLKCAIRKAIMILLGVMALIGIMIFTLRNTMAKKRMFLKNITHHKMIAPATLPVPLVVSPINQLAPINVSLVKTVKTSKNLMVQKHKLQVIVTRNYLMNMSLIINKNVLTGYKTVLFIILN